MGYENKKITLLTLPEFCELVGQNEFDVELPNGDYQTFKFIKKSEDLIEDGNGVVLVSDDGLGDRITLMDGVCVKYHHEKFEILNCTEELRDYE